MKLSLSVNTTIIYDSKLEQKLKKHQKGRCYFCSVTLSKELYVLKEGVEKCLSCKICMHTKCMEKIPSSSEGRIIMMPEVSQIEIISLARAIHYLKMMSKDIEDEVDSLNLIEEEFTERGEIANHYYSAGIADPVILIQLLLSLDEEDYKKRDLVLFGLRWLPNISYYKEEEIILKEEYKKYNPKNWNKLIKSVVNKKS
jgi:hypothetical protein